MCQLRDNGIEPRRRDTSPEKSLATERFGKRRAFKVPLPKISIDASFSPDVHEVFVFPQSYKLRMSQVTVRCPLRKLDLRHELGLKPLAILHLLFR